MSSKKGRVLFALGITSALGIAWLLRQRGEEMRGLRCLRQVLTRRHGAGKAEHLVAAVLQEHAVLLAETPMPENRDLRWHLKENILPGLAMYRVLLQEHDNDRQAALAEVDEVIRTRTLAANCLLLAPLKVLPAPFGIFRAGFGLAMKKFPAEGWDITYIENGKDRVAFNITRCFYLNTLTACGAPELTASFCKSDDVMAELFPPSIRFERLHTLGRGDMVCDFRYCRVEKP